MQKKKYKSAQSAKVSLTKHLRLNIVWKHLSAKVHPSLSKIYHNDHHREISVSCKVLNAFEIRGRASMNALGDFSLHWYDEQEYSQ